MAKVSNLYSYGAILLFFAFVLQALMALTVAQAIGRDAAIVLFVAGVSTMVLITPYVFGLLKFDLFSPLTLILGTFVMGTGWRIPYIISNIDESVRAQFLMYGMSFEALSEHAIWFLLGVVSLMFGYISTQKRFDLSRLTFWSQYQFNPPRLYLISLVFGGVGAGFGAMFLLTGGVNLSGGDLLGSAQKIHLSTKEDVGVIAGMSRFFSSWAVYPFVALSSAVLLKIMPRRPQTWVILALLAIPVIAVPFLSSARAALITNMLAIIIVLYYYGKLNPMKFAVTAVLVLALISFMGQLRSQNKGLDTQQLGLIAGFVASGNGVDMVRSLAIMENVPERTDYLYGKSYLTFLTFPIPRTVWRDKPEVGLGPFIKSEVLGGRVLDKNGWPSGIVGEAYLNFGKLGLFVMMFLYGALNRIVYNSFRPHLGKSFALTLLYGVLIFRFSFSTTMLNFAHGLTGAALIFVPFFLFMLACRRYPKRYG